WPPAMPTAVESISRFVLAVEASPAVTLTATLLLVVVALAAALPPLAGGMASLPLPASLPGPPDPGGVRAVRDAMLHGLMVRLTLTLSIVEAAVAVTAPELEIRSLPVPASMPTARVSRVVVALTLPPPSSVSVGPALLMLVAAPTLSVPALVMLSLPLPPVIPEAVGAAGSVQACDLPRS